MSYFLRFNTNQNERWQIRRVCPTLHHFDWKLKPRNEVILAVYSKLLHGLDQFGWLTIREDFIGLRYFFKLFGCLFLIIRILVWMPLQCESSVSKRAKKIMNNKRQSTFCVLFLCFSFFSFGKRYESHVEVTWFSRTRSWMKTELSTPLIRVYRFKFGFKNLRFLYVSGRACLFHFQYRVKVHHLEAQGRSLVHKDQLVDGKIDIT